MTSARSGIHASSIRQSTPIVVLVVCMLAIGLAPDATAQPDKPELRGVSLTLTAKPVGCTVYLDGDFGLVTTAPTNLVEEFNGAYKITAVRDGYETYRSSVVFVGGQPQTHNIVLKPKTRAKSAMRSIVLPGWGQYYAGEGGRSAFWAIASIASATGGLVYELRWRDRKNELDDARDEFEDAKTVPERERWAEEVERLNTRAYDAESDRRTAWAVLGGVWAANVIDAFILFPDHRKYAEAPLHISSSTINGTPAVKLAFRF